MPPTEHEHQIDAYEQGFNGNLFDGYLVYMNWFQYGRYVKDLMEKENLPEIVAKEKVHKPNGNKNLAFLI